VGVAVSPATVDEASEWDRHWYLGWLMPVAWTLRFELSNKVGDHIEQGFEAAGLWLGGG
jgi:hypothetical protein